MSPHWFRRLIQTGPLPSQLNLICRHTRLTPMRPDYDVQELTMAAVFLVLMLVVIVLAFAVA